MMGIDGWIDIHLCQPFHSDFLNFIAFFLNRLGKGDALSFVCILLIIFGYFVGKSRHIKIGTVGIAVLAFSGIAVQILKRLLGRARPQMNLGDLYFIGPNLVKNGFDSFPSGHAFSSFALAAYLSYLYPKWRNVFYLTAGAISIIGRVMLRYHYMSDVIAGAMLGILSGYFFAKKFDPWIQKDEKEPTQDVIPVKTGIQNFLEQKELDSCLRRNDNIVDLIFVILFSSLILITGLSNSSLWDRDETEYAQATIEMNQKNEWLIPTLEREPFIEKPILLYWCTRLSTNFFGVNEFAFRFPSVIFGILTCIATYFLGRKIGRGKTGLFSALILSSSFLFVGSFRLLLTDPLFVFFSLLSFLFYLYSAENSKFLFLSYASIGLSVLSKGPIAFFPIPVFLIFEWIQKKNLFQIILKHSFLSLIPILIASPWFIYSFSVQEKATSNFFVYDNILRFFEGMEGHTGPMFYYILVLLIGLFPWFFFLIPYFKKEWKNRISKKIPMNPDILLLSLWSSFLFIFFSIAANKLPHYILPALPPLACLLGKFWNEETEEKSSNLKSPIMISIVLSVCLYLALISLNWIRPSYTSIKLRIPFIILTISMGLAYFGNQKKEVRNSFYAILFGSLFLFMTFSIWSLPWIEKYRVTKPVGLAIKKYAGADSKIIGYHFSEPSLFIYGGKLFPKIEDTPLDEILKNPLPTYIVISESQLKESSPKIPYTVLEKKEGFAENEGEMTLMLITNKIGI